MDGMEEYRDKVDERISMDNEQQPWWNDKDKAAGLTATVVLLGIALLFLAGCIKLITLMF